MLLRRDQQALKPAVNSLTCREMLDLIVEHLLADLPAELRDQVDSHLADCPRCRGKRHALEIAAFVHDGRAHES